ncbi:40s ribosomal protein s5-1 [Hordeum vulgare]|nr:40s ribosomal protein s5-1 [Hordeum vulgare]
MSEGMLHIRDVEGPKKTGSMETRLEAMEQQVFKCQGMVERGLNANHTMITEFTSNHKMDAIDIGKHLSTLYDRVDQLQGQIYDLQNQNCEYEYRFKSIRSRSSIVIFDSSSGERSDSDVSNINPPPVVDAYNSASDQKGKGSAWQISYLSYLAHSMYQLVLVSIRETI